MGAALAVMDERKLHVREGYPSLFAYCTRRLHLSEPAACRRIDAARASRAYPLILERLAEGTLTLAAVGLLWKHLTPANHVAVLDAARHRSKREIEELAARLSPRPDVPSSIRNLPAPRDPRVEAADGAPGAGAGGPMLPKATAARLDSHLPPIADVLAGSGGGASPSPASALARFGVASSATGGPRLDLGLAGDVALPPTPVSCRNWQGSGAPAGHDQPRPPPGHLPPPGKSSRRATRCRVGGGGSFPPLVEIVCG